MKLPNHGFPVLVLAAAISQASFADGVAEPDFSATVQGTPVRINVLSNDSSTNDSSLSVGSFSSFTAEYGTVVLNNDQSLVYTPDAAFTGEDTFTYQAVDDSGYGSFATVTVYVYAAGANQEEGPIESRVTGDSNKRTARMLEGVCIERDRSNLSPELSSSCDTLLGVGSDDINDVVAQIAPDEILVMRNVMSGTSRNHTGRVSKHQGSLRSGRTSRAVVVDASGFHLNNYRGGNAGDEQNSPIGVFASVQIDNSEHDQTQFESAYESEAYGVTVGMDYRLNPGMHVGGAVNWLTNEVTYDNNGGAVDADLYTLTGFLTWFSGPLGVDLQMGYSSGDFSTQRNLSYFSTRALGDTQSDQYNLSAQADWSIAMDAWTFRPFLRMDYLSSQVDGYSETGGGGWAMAVGEQDMEQITSTLGLDTSYAISMNWGVLVPTLKLSALNDSSADYSPVVFSLVGDSSNTEFALQPDGEDSLYYLVDVGAVFQLKNGISTFITYQQMIGYEDLEAFQFSGGIRLEL